MNILGSAFKLGAGLAVGTGVALVAPAVVPIAAGIARRVAIAAIKGGLFAFEGFKITLTGAREMLEDLVAEAKAESRRNRTESLE